MMKKICMISFVLHFAAAGSGCASGNDKKAAEAAPAKVYMTRDISPAGMKAVYEALGRKAEGKKVAVKLSTGEPGGNNFLQPALIGDLVKSVKGTIVCIGQLQESAFLHRPRYYFYAVSNLSTNPV